MLQFAIETARDAGHLLLEKFGRITAVTKKGDINLVTEADLASEALIIERIKSHHPKHAILAEEAGDAVVVDGSGGTNSSPPRRPRARRLTASPSPFPRPSISANL